MENDPNNANAPATKADLAEAVAATKTEFKELFNTQKEEMERLLAAIQPHSWGRGRADGQEVEWKIRSRHD